MKGVHPVGIDESRQVGRTTNSADDQNLVRLETQLEERCLQRRENGKIAAPRTPVGMNLAFVAVPCELTGLDCRGGGRRCGFDCGAHRFLKRSLRGWGRKSPVCLRVVLSPR